MPNSGKIGRLSFSVNSFVCSKFFGTNEVLQKIRRKSCGWVGCRTWARQQLVELSAIFFPVTCVACGQDVLCDQTQENQLGDIKIPLCEMCRFEVADQGPRCDHCGLPGHGGSSCLLCQNLSHQLSEDRVLWKRMFVLGSYRGRLRENVLAAKRPSGEGLVEALSDVLIEQHPDISNLMLDAVVPVPMHWRRRWHRGTNSANTMARRIASRINVPYRCDIRQKIFTNPQKSLSAKMRPANASAKFSVVSSQFAGKRVLVVDDVATTGATLTAMTRCLLENKAAVVYAAVLARTDGAMNNDNNH